MAAPSGALRADLGAHVPAAWPLSVRYNGSVDSSEEWDFERSFAIRELRVSAREKPPSVSGNVQW